MRITTKGQVTIPAHIRSYLGVGPHSDVEFTIRDGQVILHAPEEPQASSRPSRFARLRGYRKGKLTTDEWMRATRGDTCESS
jgi:AbrB family looped-hinge helix DNA binding protein